MKKLIILLVGSLLLLSFKPKDQHDVINTSEETSAWGSLTFSITTSSNNGTYAPKHVLAIWIRDANDNFIKTRKLRGNNRKGYLYTWKNNSGQDVTDAITGATLSNHTSHTITWDCTDISGSLVPDGDYKVAVEFTDKHAQGPYAEFTFTKGPNPVHLTPANQGKFSNIDLQYTPSPVGLTQYEPGNSLKAYPNPAKNHLHIEIPELALKEGANLQITDLKGAIYYTSDIAKNQSGGIMTLKLEDLSITPGIYIIRLTTSQTSSTIKFLVSN